MTKTYYFRLQEQELKNPSWNLWTYNWKSKQFGWSNSLLSEHFTSFSLIVPEPEKNTAQLLGTTKSIYLESPLDFYPIGKNGKINFSLFKIKPHNLYFYSYFHFASLIPTLLPHLSTIFLGRIFDSLAAFNLIQESINLDYF